jgi:putative flippase GtrA
MAERIRPVRDGKLDGSIPDRKLTPDPASRLRRLVGFHLANGSVSLVGNLALTAALLRYLRMSVLAASFLAICLCSLVNFLLGDR